MRIAEVILYANDSNNSLLWKHDTKEKFDFLKTLVSRGKSDRGKITLCLMNLMSIIDSHCRMVFSKKVQSIFVNKIFYLMTPLAELKIRDIYHQMKKGMEKDSIEFSTILFTS